MGAEVIGVEAVRVRPPPDARSDCSRVERRMRAFEEGDLAADVFSERVVQPPVKQGPTPSVSAHTNLSSSQATLSGPCSLTAAANDAPEHVRGGCACNDNSVVLSGQLLNPSQGLNRLLKAVGSDRQVSERNSPPSCEAESQRRLRRLAGEEVQALIADYQAGASIQSLAKSYGIHR